MAPRQRTTPDGGSMPSSTWPRLPVGRGVEWSRVVPDETVDAAGRLGEQSFGPGRQIVLHARDPPDVVDRSPWWYRLAQRIRGELADNASQLEGDAVGLLPGLVVGDTSGISDRLDADAKITGVTHLLAVSGSHFAILCGMV